MISPTLIREARLRAGLTQAALGMRAGLAQSAIARWESGRVRPSMETVARLVRACGLELRLGLAPPDAEETTLIDQQLRLTPTQRLQQLTRTVRFIQSGRGKVRA
ncbi:MAG: helix-turn-helix domain-containing protein [Gemmatimonadota bacterium]|nr:helix-turn-helix domain-containing protein [Gemmatimonadota bacterium]